MQNQDFYVARSATTNLLQGLGKALEAPAQHPVVFQAYGLGGIGKTRLVQDVTKFLPQAKVIPIEVTDTGLQELQAPLVLMNKIYQQLPPPDGWPGDFPDWYGKYEKTRQFVEKDEQGKILIKATQNLAAMLPKPIGEVVKHVGQAVLDAPDPMEQLENFLLRFSRTNGQSAVQQALRELMLKPYEVLTRHFVKDLKAQLGQQPVVVVLDVYEQVGQDIDLWLVRYLLKEGNWWDLRFRLVITGCNRLSDREGWRDLAKNHNGYVQEIEIPAFDLEQTQQFLQHYQIQEVDRIFEVTKGWPYYLNLISVPDKKLEVVGRTRFDGSY